MLYLLLEMENLKWGINLNKQKIKILILIICLIISVSITLITPSLVGKIIDQMPKNSISILLIVLSFLYLLLAIIDCIIAYQISKFATEISKKLREAVFNKMQKMPIEYFDKYPHGEISNLFASDVENIIQGVIQGTSKLGRGIITILGVGIILFTINIWMAILICTTAPILYGISYMTTKYTQKFFKQRAKEIATFNGYTQEIVLGQQTIRDFLYEGKTQEKFDEKNSRLYDLGKKARFLFFNNKPCYTLY